MVGQLTAILSAMCYALSYIFIRKGQAESSPPDHGLLPILAISVLILGGASATLMIMHPSVIDLSPEQVMLPTAYAALSGLIGTLLGRLTLYRAIRDLGATRGVVIKGLSPIMTLLIVATVFDQQIVSDDFIGLICLLIAVLFLFLERKYNYERSMSFAFFRNGIFIAVLSACAQGLGHAFRQLSVTGALVPLFAATIDVTTALLIYMLLLSLRGRLLRMIAWYFSSTNIFLFAAGVCSSLGVLLFFTAVNIVPVSTVSVLAASEPVIVALFSVLFFPQLERLTWWSVLASIIVAVGVVLISI